LFTWSITGSTVIKAETLDEAQAKFDTVGIADLLMDLKTSGSDFAQDQIFVESEPGCFDIEAAANGSLRK
jgi:hypothetical protein